MTKYKASYGLGVIGNYARWNRRTDTQTLQLLYGIGRGADSVKISLPQTKCWKLCEILQSCLKYP